MYGHVFYVRYFGYIIQYVECQTGGGAGDGDVGWGKCDKMFYYRWVGVSLAERLSASSHVLGNVTKQEVVVNVWLDVSKSG